MRNERILVIEDDPGVGEAIRQLLENIGYQTELATTGDGGLARARSGEFALLITDLRLPDRDGLSIIRSNPHLRDLQIDNSSAQLELQTDDAGVAALLQQLVQNGVGVRSFGEKEPTLEDVFMMVTKGLVS